MSYFLTTVSHGSTGIKTINCGFQPTGARITVGASGNNDTNAQMSVGITDGTNQICDAWYQDASRGKQDRVSNKLVNVWDWNGSAFYNPSQATFDSFTSTQFKYNVTTADSNYQYLIECWN